MKPPKNRWHCLPSILLGCLAVLLSSTQGGDGRGLARLGFIDQSGVVSGTVVRVVNLNSSGPGSLRAAVEMEGPRIIVFEVGGVIDLRMKGLNIVQPHLTIAGQTAPSPGITLIRGGVVIRTHHVEVRHIRVRPGDAGQRKRSGWSPDGISTYGGEAHDIWIDHCSISWAVDENLSASGPRLDGPEATSRRVTFSNCIIAEALHDASHSKGPHSKGSLIHDYCTGIAIIGNLYAHNMARNPLFKAHTTGVIANNVIYNPGKTAVRVDHVDSEWIRSAVEPHPGRVSVVGNVLIHGHDTMANLPLVRGRGLVYLHGNHVIDRTGFVTAARIDRGIRRLRKKPIWPHGFKAIRSDQVVVDVLLHAGARPKDRDAADLRIIRDVARRQGRIIDSQDDVGGYPRPRPTRRKLKVPEDPKKIAGWLGKMAGMLE